MSVATVLCRRQNRLQFRNLECPRGVERRVFRLRWSDPEPDDRLMLIDWRVPALIIATLSFNFFFWWEHNVDVCVPGPLFGHAVLLGTVSLLMLVLFFLGPAFAAQAAGRPLLGVVEYSLGSIPALGLRVCCVLFLVGWIAKLAEVPGMWWYSSGPRWELSSIQSNLVAASILLFLFYTGLRSLQTNAKMARFTIKLAIAFLVAALLRVREGWPHALSGFPASGGCSDPLRFWHGLTWLVSYVGPLAFLAAGFGLRSQERKQVLKIGLWGLVAPLWGTMLVVSFIDLATFATPFYQPSGDANIAMALWGQARKSHASGYLMISAITVFGAVRFGVIALQELVPMLAASRRLRWFVLVGLAGTIAWLPSNNAVFQALFRWPTTCLVVAAAVLTVDCATERWRRVKVRKVDWVGLAALLAGCATPLCLPNWLVGATSDVAWHPWLLPSYGMGLLVCVSGRAVQKLAAARLSS
jgi:hypothetical protein